MPKWVILLSALGSFGLLACSGARLRVGDDGVGGAQAGFSGHAGGAGGQAGAAGGNAGGAGGQAGAVGGHAAAGMIVGGGGSIDAAGAGGVDAAPAATADASADTASDRGPSDVGGDAAGPSDAAQDLASDGGPDAESSCASTFDTQHCGSCDHDCTKLPNVINTPEALSCQGGVCYAFQCAVGYAHCSTTTVDHACETSLWSDVTNCGGCGVTCGQTPGSPGICHNGACVGECPAGKGDCTDAFGCETTLNSPEDCGACGQPACNLANVLAACVEPVPSCADGICAPGYGNCDPASPDCETAYGVGGTCLPAYAGTTWLPTGEYGVAAVGADGTRFLGGQFIDPTDFDFTAGVDMRAPSSPPAPYHSAPSPYVTMVKPDGGYGWTHTFATSPLDYANPAQAGVTALAVPADGGVIVGGTFVGNLVLDPKSGVAGPAYSGSTFIVRLDASGGYVWGLTLGLSNALAWINVGSLAVATDGSIYVGGMFQGQIDFDPGPGTVNRVGNGYVGGSPFILKLNKDRSFAWVDTWSVPSSCVFYPSRIAVAPGGAVWAGGSYGGTCDFDPGSGVDRRQLANATQSYLLALSASGTYIGAWTFGVYGGVSDLVADSKGAVYAVGTFTGDSDFDPGSGEALRARAPQGSSFLLTLNASGAFQWVTTQTEFTATAVTLGPGGTVLVGGMFGAPANEAGVIAYHADHSLGWTLGFGSPDMAVSSLATTSAGLFVAGYVYWDTDLDPGPGIDTVPPGNIGGNPFVSSFKL